MGRDRTAIMKRMPRILLPLSVALAIGGLGAPMVVASESRSAEMSESAPSKEHKEEISTPGRCDRHRHLPIGDHPSVILFIHRATPTLGHAQHDVLETARGHRLPNGLLAPLTC